MGAERTAALASMNRLRRSGCCAGILARVARAGSAALTRTNTNDQTPREPAVLEAIHRLFNHPTLRKILLKSRVLLGVAVIGAIVWYMDPKWLLPGSSCRCSVRRSSSGASPRWTRAAPSPATAIRDRAQPDVPWALLHHPRRTDAARPVVAARRVHVIYYFYMVNRVKREEEYLRGVLGAPYAEYLRTVNGSAGRATARQSTRVLGLKLLKQNHGTANLVGTLVFWRRRSCGAIRSG